MTQNTLNTNRFGYRDLTGETSQFHFAAMNKLISAESISGEEHFFKDMFIPSDTLARSPELFQDCPMGSVQLNNAGQVATTVENNGNSRGNVAILCADGAGGFDQDKMDERLKGFSVEYDNPDDWTKDNYDLTKPDQFRQAFKDSLETSDYIILRAHGGRDQDLNFSRLEGRDWYGYGSYYDEMSVSDLIKSIEDAKKDGTLKTKMIVMDSCFSADLKPEDIEALKKTGVIYIGCGYNNGNPADINEDSQMMTNNPLTIVSEYQKNPNNLNSIINDVNSKRGLNPPYQVYAPDYMHN